LLIVMPACRPMQWASSYAASGFIFINTRATSRTVPSPKENSMPAPTQSLPTSTPNADSVAHAKLWLYAWLWICAFLAKDAASSCKRERLEASSADFKKFLEALVMLEAKRCVAIRSRLCFCYWLKQDSTRESICYYLVIIALIMHENISS